MKNKSILIAFLLTAAYFLNGQNDLQFIKVKNADSTVSISVINHSSKVYSVEVQLELVNMKADRTLPIEFVVEPKGKKAIAILTPLLGKRWNYLINYRIIEVVSDVEGFSYEPNITIYTKNKNSRSTQLNIYLRQNGIAYNEINTSYNGDAKAIFHAMLKRRGIEEKDAILPVVIYRGEVFYQIKDIKKFCEKHFANEGHFVKKNERKY